ncbi:response regulator [Comamonadaceae bacterium OTU4NAUVB1]|jgi:twitching motility two-component system response regulator PilG|nr:response regulator [Comamonadaceae bacterium OTU4NAUVB1]HSU24257.1 response regulator [Variovorax sp.]
MGANGSPRRVLVIDDSHTVRRSAEIFLAQGGCEVLLAADGFEGLARVADARPDIVFCDIQMPRLDGWRTRAIVRRHPDFHDLPMVMLSASDSAFEDPRGGEAGAPEHLVKPFTGEQLLDAVRRLARAPAGAGG